MGNRNSQAGNQNIVRVTAEELEKAVQTIIKNQSAYFTRI